MAEAAQRRAAGALRTAGLAPGDRVAFCLPSSAALLCAVLGALRTGVVPVLLNATLTEAERDELDRRLPARGWWSPTPIAWPRWTAGSPVELAPYPLARPMHYTSGTTGRAKGVWSGVWDAATAEAAFVDEADLWSFGPDDVHLVCSPMYHSVSIRFAGGTLLRGGTCVILSRFDAGVALEALRGAGPGAHHHLHGPGGPQRASWTRPVTGTQAWRPCGCWSTPVRRALRRSSGGPSSVVGPGVLWEFYGSTEGQFTVCSPDEWLARPGTVGRARPGRTLSVDEDGTIWCRAPRFARFRYWRDEDKTAAAWRDGVFTVGDLGRIDADGYLFLDGRRDDLIITGGVNVYPAEVEAVLSEVAGVVGAGGVRSARRPMGPTGLCGGGARRAGRSGDGTATDRSRPGPRRHRAGRLQATQGVRGAGRAPPDRHRQGAEEPDPGLVEPGLIPGPGLPSLFGPRAT